MQTPFGDISEDDIHTLQFRLYWYLKYGCLPSIHRRQRTDACVDYGRQYERYVGYLFAARGFTVQYTGIRRGMEDGGIDLVAHAPRKYRLVQCKRWQNAVDVDTISRLQGAISRFNWETQTTKTPLSRTDIRGVLVTSGDVTPKAEEMARFYRICVMKNTPFQTYPAIKAQQIIPGAGRFLLPFDAHYDEMTLHPSHGDRFFNTIREALSQGFYYPPYHRPILKHLYTLRNQSTSK